eukprot:m.78791 g.78791  ORF g.78791 m.78791 type:complete len:409 (+) comp14760_c0_seq3:424-1650(+)
MAAGAFERSSEVGPHARYEWVVGAALSLRQVEGPPVERRRLLEVAKEVVRDCRLGQGRGLLDSGESESLAVVFKSLGAALGNLLLLFVVIVIGAFAFALVTAVAVLQRQVAPHRDGQVVVDCIGLPALRVGAPDGLSILQGCLQRLLRLGAVAHLAVNEALQVVEGGIELLRPGECWRQRGERGAARLQGGGVVLQLQLAGGHVAVGGSGACVLRAGCGQADLQSALAHLEGGFKIAGCAVAFGDGDAEARSFAVLLAGHRLLHLQRLVEHLAGPVDVASDAERLAEPAIGCHAEVRLAVDLPLRAAPHGQEELHCLDDKRVLFGKLGRRREPEQRGTGRAVGPVDGRDGVSVVQRRLQEVAAQKRSQLVVDRGVAHAAHGGVQGLVVGRLRGLRVGRVDAMPPPGSP